MDQAQAIYYGCAAFVAFSASAVMFFVHADFRRRAGLLPPKVVYGKDYLGKEDPTNIVWKTPPLVGFTDQQIGEANGFQFFIKWALIFGGIFLAATSIIKWHGIK